MAVIDFIHRGVRYISDDAGHFTYKNYNYLKFYLTEDLISTYNINLSHPMDVYVNSITPGEGVLYIVQLSLSHRPDENIIPQTIATNLAGIYNYINMPEARIKFHPNGGVAASGKSINSIDKCSTSQNTFSEKNLYNVDTLFTKTGYTGTGWTLLHPTNKDQFLTISQDNQTETSAERFANKIDLYDDYVPIYPETAYYLYANWTPKQYKITYYHSWGLPITNTDGTTKETLITYKSSITIPSDIIPGDVSDAIFSGWEEKDKNTTYYYGSTFFLDQPNDVKLFPVYTTAGSDDLVYYYPNGGLGGVQSYTQSGTRINLKPDGKPETNQYGDWVAQSLPYRMGYRFTGWKSKKTGDVKQPGELINTNNQGRIWIAQWDTNLADTYSTQTTGPETETIINRNYHQYTENFLIEPSSVDRTITLSPIQYTGVYYKYAFAVCWRIFNQKGETVPGSYCRWIHKKNESVSNTVVSLPADQTYQIQVASEYIGNEFSEMWEDREYQWTFSQTLSSITATISPNGGSFKVGTNTSYSNNDISLSNFPPNKNWIGISSNTSSGLSTFNGIANQYPGLPDQHTGYWYSKKWIGTTEMVPNYLQTISSITAWATPLPQKSFSVSAVWNPNKFYIQYHGNGNDSNTAMANSSHDYKGTVSLSQNLYTRSTKINLDSRYGNYNNFTTWWNSLSDQVTVSAGSNNNVQVCSVKHTHNGWSASDKTLSASYSKSYDSFKDDLGISEPSPLSNYGTTVVLTAIWNFNGITLPVMEREGFKFLGWYTAPEGGTFKGMGGASYVCEDKEVTLYAHWEPIGLVQIYVDNKWKYAIPYVYDGTSWKRAMQYTYNGTTWKQGAGSGQNMTNQQLENL